MRWLRQIAGLGVLVVACAAPSRRPSTAARLFVGHEAWVDDGPFRIVFAGPKGELAEAHDVTLAFSRPLRAPGVQLEGATAGAVRRVPDGAPLAGSWRWFGERTAVFWPTNGFELATEYEVSVEPTLRAFDGSSLAPMPSFRFASARPELSAASYTWDEDLKQARVDVELNQAVTAEAVRAALHIEGKGPRGVVSVPFRFLPLEPSPEQPDEAQARYALVADSAIVALSDVAVVAAASLRGAQGNLTSGREIRLALPEVGPLRARIVCGRSYGNEPEVAWVQSAAARCPSDGAGASLEFSKPVNEPQLSRFLALPRPHRPLQPGTSSTDWAALDDLIELAAGKKYRILVKAGLTATDGDRLSADQVLELEMADHAPRRELRDVNLDYRSPPGIVVEAARSSVQLRFDVLNVPSLEVTTARIAEPQLLALLGQKALSLETLRALPGAQASRLPLRAKRNQEALASVSLPGPRAAGDTGLFAVGTRGEGLTENVNLISVTDLGLTSKWSSQGGLVWVTRLSSGAAVENARVALFDGERELYAAATNAEGIANIPPEVAEKLPRDGEPPVAVVRAGGDVAFTRLPQPRGHPRGLALLFAERRLYRPGETVHVKGIFRAAGPRGLFAPVGKQVWLQATDADDRVLFSTQASLDAFGAFACDVPLPRDVRLGFARLKARAGEEPPSRDHDVWDAVAGISIDEFRAVEMQLHARAARPAYLAGERAELRVEGRYLFGAPLHDRSVKLRATRSLASYWPPALRGFESDPSQFWSRLASHELMSGEALLDRSGLARPGIALTLPQQIATERVEVEASVEDVSGAFEVSSETSFLVHPAEIYVGLRRGGNAEPRAAKPFTVEVAASGWGDGPLRAGVPVHVELWRRSQGWDLALGQCDVVTTTSTASCTFSVPEKGKYWAVAHGRDSAGRIARAALEIEVSEPPAGLAVPQLRALAPQKRALPEAAPLSFEQECVLAMPREEQALRVNGNGWDKPFQVGETLTSCLRGTGLALLTQEREGVLGSETLSLVGPGTLHGVAITPALSPNFDLKFHSVRGRQRPFPTRGRADRGPPWSGDSQEEVRVIRPPEQALRVAIETFAEHRPGEQLDARVKVVDGLGRPVLAQVTLWAVDEGVVLLDPFSVPAASDYFGQERYVTVSTNDTRDGILSEREGGSHRASSPQLRMGATGTSPSSHIGRTVFRPTAFFLPRLITGPDGVAHARVKLPDNLTTWRVFAVASDTAQGFGEAESTFITNKPLAARPGLPRFLRSGDRFDATVTIDSMLRRSELVKLELSADGALSGSATRSIQVPAHGHVPVSFPVLANGRGQAHVRFRVATRTGLVDDITLPEEVSVPTTLETVVVSGQTSTRRDEPLGDLSLARGDVGGLSYRLSSTPLVGLAESLQQLVDYPYGCTEQLWSRLVPLLRLRHLARAVRVNLPPDVDAAVTSAVQGLLTHQHPDGSFGFWRESPGEAWLSVGVLRALEESRRAGFAVPQTALDNAAQWLDKKTGEDASAAALFEDLLASLGRARPDKLRALALDERLPPFARAALAHGLAAVDRELAKQVLDRVSSHARISGASAVVGDDGSLDRRSHLSSEARTTALVLRAFIAVEPRSPLVAQLIHGLLGLRRGGRWATTQESAWALLALDDAYTALAPAGSQGTSQLVFGDNQLAEARGNEIKTGSLTMAQLLQSPGAALSFRSSGAPLYFEAHLRYARAEPPKTPLEHGIHVARAFELDAEHPGVSLQNLSVGDRIDVEVVLGSATRRELVVVEDPIPAGFEAVNQDFANDDMNRHGRHGDSFTHRELRDDRVLTFFDVLPAGLTTLRYPLRAIAAGRFSHPPAKAECMYDPDVFGRTAAGSAEVH